MPAGCPRSMKRSPPPPAADLEVPDHATANVKISLPTVAGGHVQLRQAGAEVPDLEAKTDRMPHPHIQAATELEYSRGGASWAGVLSSKDQRIAFLEVSEASS